MRIHADPEHWFYGIFFYLQKRFTLTQYCGSGFFEYRTFKIYADKKKWPIKYKYEFKKKYELTIPVPGTDKNHSINYVNIFLI